METKRSDKVLKYILVFVAAALAVLGQNIELYHGFTLEEKYPWFMTVAEVFAVFALFSVVLYFLSKVSFEKLDALLPNGKLWDRKWMFLYIAIVDTVLLVLVYPGIEGGLDTQYQIKDFLDGTAPLYYYEGDTTITHSLNDHHPVLTSIVYGGATWLATKVGHPQLGSFVLNFLQVLCFSASFVYATDYMTSLNETFRKLTAAFYMFYPVFAYFAVTMVKDSFFGFLFLLYYVLFLKIYDGTASKKELWWFVARPFPSGKARSTQQAQHRLQRPLTGARHVRAAAVHPVPGLPRLSGRQTGSVRRSVPADRTAEDRPSGGVHER